MHLKCLSVFDAVNTQYLRTVHIFSKNKLWLIHFVKIQNDLFKHYHSSNNHKLMIEFVKYPSFKN